MKFSRAITRTPSHNFAQGLTTVDLGVPDFPLALEQHTQYCQVLAQCGLTITNLFPDEIYPDATFVEDTAIITAQGAILTHPGAASRSGEVTSIKVALSEFFDEMMKIEAPGTVDGGDICEADNHFFIGISARTNEEGAQQLAKILMGWGYRTTFIDIRGIDTILHLKSGLSYLGDGCLVAIDALTKLGSFAGYQVIEVDPLEEYAANCIRVNDYVLVAAGYPKFHNIITQLGYQIKVLEMSEFHKMDGGLSCLSLRF